MSELLEIIHLSKAYGKKKAVDDISFCVKKGELFAFLGVNGAGKSTTISMICGAQRKDSGSILFCGQDMEKDTTDIKTKIGVVFQNSVLDQFLTVHDNLRYRAAMYGIVGADFEKRYEELTELFDLKEMERQKVKNLSGGQRRRVDIARAVLHNPEFLILDEPTTGLDPGTRKKLWGIVRNLRDRQNLTVFLTTHYMEEAADADNIVILDKGKIIAEGTPLDLKNKYAKDTITIYQANEEEIKTLNLPYKKIKNGCRLEISSTRDATDLIVNHQELFHDYEIVKGKMDDVFLAATGTALEENE